MDTFLLELLLLKFDTVQKLGVYFSINISFALAGSGLRSVFDASLSF